MQKIIHNLFHKEFSNQEILTIFYRLFFFNLFASIFLSVFFSLLLPQYLPSGDLVQEMLNSKLYENFQKIVFFTLLFVIMEELFFRFPLSLFVRRNISIILKVILTLSLALLFGFMHVWNSSEEKILFPLIQQGVLSGLSLSYLYLASGANVGKKLKALGFVILFHFCWNIFLITMYFVGMKYVM